MNLSENENYEKHETICANCIYVFIKKNYSLVTNVPVSLHKKNRT